MSAQAACDVSPRSGRPKQYQALWLRPPEFGRTREGLLRAMAIASGSFPCFPGGPRSSRYWMAITSQHESGQIRRPHGFCCGKSRDLLSLLPALSHPSSRLVLSRLFWVGPMTADEIWALTGQTHYNYSALCGISDEAVAKYVNGSRQKFGVLASDWDEAKNTEWLSRLYLSLKLMLSSQLLVSSLTYAEDKNLQLVSPYLSYYTLLNCCRALLFTAPYVAWRDGTLRESTHRKIINETKNDLRNLSPQVSHEFSDVMTASKSARELFSYHFPATGMSVVTQRVPVDKVHDAATRLCDLAEANSECLASALEKKGISDCTVDLGMLSDICEYEAPTNAIDADDWYRTRYLARKSRLPMSLAWMATDGLIEDFFGAWMPQDGEEPTDGKFHPDAGYCGLIFDYTY
jgi:hypothetical protein